MSGGKFTGIDLFMEPTAPPSACPMPFLRPSADYTFCLANSMSASNDIQLLKIILRTNRHLVFLKYREPFNFACPPS